MINGYEYAYEDLQVVVNGFAAEPLEVEYGATRNHYNIHGRGAKPRRMARGKKDATPGRLVLLQSDFDAMVDASVKGTDPTDWIDFETIVSYAPEGGIVRTDVVPNCRVAEWKKGMKTEDGHMTIELSLVTGIPKLNI